MSIDRARTLVPGTVNQQRNSRLDQSAGAHSAWLNRGINCRVSQPVVANLSGRLPDGEDLSMGGRITVGAGAIAGYGDNFAPQDDTGANRHLLPRFSLPRGA